MSLLDLNKRQNALLGIIGSSIEVMIQHPLVILKNKYQYGSKLDFNFNFFYKGVFINMFGLGIITGYQFYVYKYLYNINKSDFTSSFLSGLSSGFIASPTEMFIIQKFNYRSFWEMNIKLIKKHGVLKVYTRGLFHTMMREAIYTSGMLSLTPYIEHKLNKYEHNVKNGLIASILSGIISGTLSHPFDTMKTLRQYHFKNNNYKRVYFKGYFPRLIRLIGTYFIINETNQRFYHIIKEYG